MAPAFGLFKGQVTLMLHCGSRGFGYQVCDDFLASMIKHVQKLGLQLPDRQLACAMIQSEMGARYLAAMACAANYAWANRQILLHRAREVFERVLGVGPRELRMRLVYDVCHNIAKKEEHVIDGRNAHRVRSSQRRHPVFSIRASGVGRRFTAWWGSR